MEPKGDQQETVEQIDEPQPGPSRERRSGPESVQEIQAMRAATFAICREIQRREMTMALTEIELDGQIEMFESLLKMLKEETEEHRREMARYSERETLKDLIARTIKAEAECQWRIEKAKKIIGRIDNTKSEKSRELYVNNVLPLMQQEISGSEEEMELMRKLRALAEEILERV